MFPFAKLWAIFPFVVLCFFSQAKADVRDQIAPMLSYFGQSCSVYGNRSQDAYRAAETLAAGLRALAGDPDCQSLSGALVDLDLVSGLSYLQPPRENAEEKEFRALQDRQIALIHLLNQPLSAADFSFFQTDYLSNRVEIARYKSYVESEQRNEEQFRRQTATTQLYGSLNALLSQVEANKKCWGKHPTVLQQVAAYSSALGHSAAVGFATGGISVLAGAGINLISRIIDHAVNVKRNSKINEISSTNEGTLFTCTLENLTEQYCEAEDALQSARIVAESIEGGQSSTDWIPLRLLEREVPNLANWLETVRAGAPSTNTDRARQRSSIYYAKYKMDKAETFLDGLLAEKKKSFDKTTQDIDKWLIMKEAVEDAISEVLLPGCGGSCVDGPYKKVFSEQIVGSYYLIGILKDQIPLAADGTRIPFSSLDPFKDLKQSFQPQLEIIQSQFRAWHERTKQFYESDRDLVSVDDPALIFEQSIARQLEGREKDLVPRESLKRLIKALSESDSGSDSDTPEIIRQESVNSLMAISNVINCQMSKKCGDLNIENLNQGLIQKQFSYKGDDLKKDRKVALGAIMVAANLENGTDFFIKRIEFLLQKKIENQVLRDIASGAGRIDPKNLKLLAAQDLIRYLQQFTSVSANDLAREAQNAQSILVASLHQFTQNFAPQIHRALDRYNNYTRFTKEDAGGRPNRVALQNLCLNLLATPDDDTLLSKKFNILKQCEGIQAESLFAKGPKGPRFSADLIKRPLNERICLYRDFRRRTDIYQRILQTR